MPIKEEPPDLPLNGTNLIFSYENLPSKYWKKYMYASRFVQMVRAKTPKITYYSDKGKCQLMETLEDFEVNFYDSCNGKIVKYSNGDVKILDDNQQLISMVTEESSLLGSLKILYEHFEKCLDHCLKLEKALSAIQLMSTKDICFPIIIGRRPQVPVNSSKENNATNLISPRSPNVSFIQRI